MIHTYYITGRGKESLICNNSYLTHLVKYKHLLFIYKVASKNLLISDLVALKSVSFLICQVLTFLSLKSTVISALLISSQIICNSFKSPNT